MSALRPTPDMDAPEPPSYLPEAPWRAFRVRGSVTPWPEQDKIGQRRSRAGASRRVRAPLTSAAP